jgi:hypothetical protein
MVLMWKKLPSAPSQSRCQRRKNAAAAVAAAVTSMAACRSGLLQLASVVLQAPPAASHHSRAALLSRRHPLGRLMRGLPVRPQQAQQQQQLHWVTERQALGGGPMPNWRPWCSKCCSRQPRLVSTP